MHKLLPCTLALSCVCAVSALAQEASTTSTASAPGAATNQSVTSTANEDARVQAVSDYWTSDRLANAIPMPVPREAPEDVSASAAPAAGPTGAGGGGLPSYRDPATESTPGRFPLSQGDDTGTGATPDAFSYEMPFSNYRAGNRNTYPYSTIGKLFFTIPPGNSEPPGDYVCSAAVAIKSYFVVTARHCVFDIGSKNFYTNWIFYPGWNNGSDSTLHGAWFPELVATWVSASTLSLTTGWDIAMMAMHDATNKGCGGNTGRTIGTYTGYLGYTYGGSYAQRQWNIFGYPQGAPFEGNYLYQDNGATGLVNPLGTTNIVEVGNPQTGGTSGGPWIIGFDPGSATDPSPNNNVNPTLKNLANGVNSFVWTRPSQPLAINGTIFQASNFWNLYTFLNAQKCS